MNAIARRPPANSGAHSRPSFAFSTARLAARIADEARCARGLATVTLLAVAPPLTLTPQVEHGIADLIALGVPLSRAARELGVPPRTARYWLGLAHDPAAAAHWQRFRESIEDARFEHERRVQLRLDEIRRQFD